VAGKVTVGLASHWPRVTDFSGLSTYGLKAYERETSTPPTLLMGYDTIHLTLQTFSALTYDLDFQFPANYGVHMQNIKVISW